ncbi:ABC transporter substrate-binding protein [Enterovibrio norvegicus]|uniref:Peptide ABC transporter substrate-binding protein n=1 Tax=Enterovibrio norvegicus TaxID=188144 RepID=A0A2N7L6H6_9GAMM|nr:ABC transporter substrate-binding protein [Enterovibrio norvegicus]PML79335.1 peptide ABC transporter substrate-binding protein [Enterovibrio norvegicus]PMN70094.1 peptide ABC transporter substrate-binding protein [Enterovibrio norvegicus]PMN89332.1 peptide ABC transporter substrate-binding protein [Enterovibrio norvegicus]
MLANLKKTKLAVAVVAAAASALAAPTVLAAEKSQLTVVPQFYPTLVQNFNPFLESALNTTTEFVYEPLVIFNQMQGNSPVMRLAQDYYMSDDLMEVTFVIRDGAKWSDGKAFTAKDVAYTVELLQAKPELDRTGLNKWVKEVKVDGNKAIFSLTQASSNAPFEIVKAPIVPEHVWSKVKNPESFANENPVGSGAFTEIDTFTSSLYVQCRNPNYWDNDNLEVDCLRVPQIAGNDQLLAKVINSELDWTSSFIPDIDSTYAAANPNHKYWYPAAGTQSFLLNYKSPKEGNNEAINDVDFRRAFSMALDRQTIIDIAFYGNGKPNDYASGLGDAFESWADKGTYNKYKGFNTFDAAGAKALLKKAGYKDINGDGFVETPSGKELKLEIQSPNGWTDFNNTVQLSVEQLNDVGIDAVARTPDFPVYNSAMANATYDVAYTNFFHGPDPHVYWNDGFNSAFQDGEGLPRFAMHHYKNAELDKLLNSFYKTSDRDEQLKIAHGIQQIIAENQITVPVMSGAFNFQYNTTRFDGWWNENNAKGRPMIWAGVQERVLQVLDLKPKS